MTTLDNKMHGFQSGDTVTFKEVKGMMALNGRQCHIEGITYLHAWHFCRYCSVLFCVYSYISLFFRAML